MKDAGLFLLKVLLALLLLPVVVALTGALLGQAEALPGPLGHQLWLGMTVYLVMMLFVYDFSHVYKFGQNIVIFLFRFLKPLVSTAPYVIPLYTIFVLLAYALLRALGKVDSTIQGYFYSALAFTFSMHVILTARDLYEKDSQPGKPNYFFSMGLIYALDVFLVALVMNAVLPGFDFVEFFRQTGRGIAQMYGAAFCQLFGVPAAGH